MDKEKIRKTQEHAFNALKIAFVEDQDIINGLELTIASLQKENASLLKKNKRLSGLLKETLDKITAWETEDGDENEDE